MLVVKLAGTSKIVFLGYGILDAELI